jgi:toxin ParE1/3/4
VGKVRLTPRAEADLFDIWATIAADNVRAADGVLKRIMHKVQLAADQPLMGAARPELSPTARILIEGRYLAIYEPEPGGLLVVAIVHGMRDPERWVS